MVTKAKKVTNKITIQEDLASDEEATDEEVFEEYTPGCIPSFGDFLKNKNK